tara:strand:- start:3869 stop:4210 length:342 start_codon:yes stop_codon:yes gene_type:complete
MKITPLNEQFRTERERLGLKQEDVAREIGIDNSMVSKVESGKAGVTTATLKKFLDFYGLEQFTRRDLLKAIDEEIEKGVTFEGSKAKKLGAIVRRPSGKAYTLKAWLQTILEA